MPRCCQFSEDRLEPGAGLMARAVPISPPSRRATDKLGDTARVEHWRHTPRARDTRRFFNNLRLDHDQIDIRQFFENTLVEGRLEALPQMAAARTPEHDVSDPVFPGKSDESLGHVLVFERDDQAPHFLGGLQSVGDMTLGRRIDANGGFLGGADIDGIPLRIKLCREPSRFAQESPRIGPKAADSHHDLSQSTDCLFRFRRCFFAAGRESWPSLPVSFPADE